jgi:hypothetical protein
VNGDEWDIRGLCQIGMAWHGMAWHDFEQCGIFMLRLSK